MNPILSGIFAIAGYYAAKYCAYSMRNVLDKAYDVNVKTFQHIVQQTPVEKKLCR